VVPCRVVASAVVVLAVAAPAVARADRAVTGSVVDAASGQPVAGASVTAGGIEVATDAAGAFVASGVPAGWFDVFVLADGYQPRLARARPGWRLTIRLTPDVGGGEIVEIQGTAPLTAEPATRVDAGEIRTLPGTGNDVLRSLQSLPGVARIPFGLGGLALRGTAPRDTHVYLDGIQVPILYHFGGLASFVPSSYIAGLQLEPGGFGVGFGRGLGGVALVDSRAGRRDRWRAGGEVSLLDASAQAEGPGPRRGSWLVGVRRSYADAILAAVPLDLTLVPRYLDTQVRWESGDGRWTAMLFGSDDNLHLVREPSGSSTGGVDTSSVAAFDYVSRFARVGVRWRGRAGATRVTITPSIGVDDVSAIANHKGVDKGMTRINGDAAVRAEISHPIDGGAVTAGADAQVTRYSWDVNDVPPPVPGLPDPNAIVHRSGSRWAGDVGMWLETAWTADGGAVGVRPGIRVDYFGLADQWTADPRLTVTHRLPRCMTMTESLGLYHQGPSVIDLDPIFGDRTLGASWAVQGSVAVTAPLRDQAKVTATAYAADLHELPVDVVTGATPVSANGSEEAGGLFGIARELIDDQFGSYSYRENRGRGLAAGLELMVRRDVGAVTGWAAYTYARSFRRGDPASDPPWLPYVLDQPQLLTVVASWRAGRHWRFGGRFRAASGNPYTPVAGAYTQPDHKGWTAIDGPLLSRRLPAFVQLDLRLDRTWYRGWGRMILFLDLQNVTNRANAEGVTYNDDYTHRSYSRGLPIFPSFGVEYQPP